jgi:hypothetical protein
MNEQQMGFLPTKNFWVTRPISGYQFGAIFIAVVLTAVVVGFLNAAVPIPRAARYGAAVILGVAFSYFGMGIAERILRSKEAAAGKSSP